MHSRVGRHWKQFYSWFVQRIIHYSHDYRLLTTIERPFYGDMLQAAANASAVDLEDYVACRLEWVAADGVAATDLTMANETVLRCQLARLPGGERSIPACSEAFVAARSAATL